MREALIVPMADYFDRMCHRHNIYHLHRPVNKVPAKSFYYFGTNALPIHIGWQEMKFGHDLDKNEFHLAMCTYISIEILTDWTANIPHNKCSISYISRIVVHSYISLTVCKKDINTV